jgi:hypothetical protein
VKNEALGEKYYTSYVVDVKSVEQFWDNTESGKLKEWEKIIIQLGW